MMGGAFQFANSNGLWRASLDVIDFMPLSSVNYSGGIIINDWYTDNKNPNESIKISIRFLTNEVRSDALDIKIFNRKCDNSFNCKFANASDVLIAGLPIVTKMGETYASRMAASLLTAVGMRELITKTAEEYENLALELAVNSCKLRKLRERLQQRLKTAPILNAELYTRNLEAGYQRAYDNYYYLNSVRNIDVTPGQLSEYTEVPK